MKFQELSNYFEKIESNSSRLVITELLSDLFKKLDPQEFDKTMYLLMGRVAPLYTALEFGMAEKMIAKAAILALNLEKKYFDQQFKKIGDIGLTVEHFKKLYASFEERDLTVLETYNMLYDLAAKSGPGSQEAKISLLAQLIRHLDSLSVKFLVRIPLGVMRLGFSDMTILDALSWMATGDKTLRPAIEAAYHVRPDLGFIGRRIKEKGIDGLKSIVPVVYTPILMMKAERLSSGEEIIGKIGKASVESKYDGFRLQIHYKKSSGEVKLFTRNLEEVSFMYPDIIDAVKKQISLEEIIFEGEAIAFDPTTGSFLPFQETVQRKRKYNIEAKAKEIPLKLFAFELLYADGESYLKTAYEKRHEKLKKIIKKSDDVISSAILIAANQLTDDPKKLEIMFEEAISKGLEGVLAKKLDGVYQPGARGWNWIKFKRSYSAHVDDTVDVLVMGYDFGRGKRTGFGIGAFLVGVLDEKKDKFVTVAKIGTGLTDDEWRELKLKSEKLRVKNKPANYEVDKAMEVDIWISPKTVVEIRADEITRSPTHTAGRVMKSSKSGSAFEVDVAGYALRFPRLERFRDDKSAHDATTLNELESLFKRQKT